MDKILKLKKYAACAALAAATVGLAGCYVAPAYGPRPYVYAAPAYGYYHYYGRPYYARPYGYGYYR